MTKSLFFVQQKPLTVKILGGLLLVFVLWFLMVGTAPLDQIVIMSIIGMLLLGYSISYEIRTNFENKRHFKIFGFSLFKSDLELFFPDYITVFSAKFKQSADWGPVGAMGKERKGDSFVVRCFKGNRHFTVYKSNSMEDAKEKAVSLSELIKVEIRGKN